MRRGIRYNHQSSVIELIQAIARKSRKSENNMS